jgi:hypothetical protein
MPTESSEKMLRIPPFPGWYAELSDGDYFGVNPDFVYLKLSTKISKQEIADGKWDMGQITAKLKEVFDGNG